MHLSRIARSSLLLSALLAPGVSKASSTHTTTWIPITPTAGKLLDTWVDDISADGQWILYEEIDGGFIEGFPFLVWRVHPDGTGRELLTPSIGGYPDHRFARSSADGSRVVFASGFAPIDFFGDFLYSDAWLLDVPSGKITKLTHHFKDGEVTGLDISWDGKTVAWHQFGGAGSGIWVWREGSGPPVRVNGDVFAFPLVGLSGDGSVLTFIGSVGQAREVFKVDLGVGPLTGGAQPEQMTFLGGHISGRADMDDHGRRVLFVWQTNGPPFSPSNLTLLDLETKKVTRVAEGVDEPRISGDGSTALVRQFVAKPGPGEHILLARIDLQGGGMHTMVARNACSAGIGFALSLDGSWAAWGSSCVPDWSGYERVHVTDPSPPSLKVAGDLTPCTEASAFVHGRPGAAALLFAAADPGELPVPGFGTFLLDPGRSVLLARAVLDDRGLFEIRRIVPESLPFGGQQLLLQALVTDPAGFTNVVALDVPP